MVLKDVFWTVASIQNGLNAHPTDAALSCHRTNESSGPLPDFQQNVVTSALFLNLMDRGNSQTLSSFIILCGYLDCD